MPIIDITMPENALNEQAKASIPEKLGQLALGYEGLTGSKFAESFTWVYIHEIPINKVTQVSGPLSKPIYRIRFTTLENLIDEQSKHKLGVDVARTMYELEGSQWNEQEAHNRVWVFFEDVREGDWIAGVKINRISELKEIVEQEKILV